MPPEPTKVPYTAPLLFRHATPRMASPDLPGHYDPARQLWVINTKSGLVPAIEAATSTLVETNTFTRVRQEGDDQDASASLQSFGALLDTSTLTKIRQESADEDLTSDETIGFPHRPLGMIAELLTKTDVQQESDDQIGMGALELEPRSPDNQEYANGDSPALLLELQTKTFANVEGDDDDLSMIR